MATVVQRPDPMAGLNTALMGYFRQMQMQKQRQDQQQQQQIENQRAQQQMGISERYAGVAEGNLALNRQNSIRRQFDDSQQTAQDQIGRRDAAEEAESKNAKDYHAFLLGGLEKYDPGSEGRKMVAAVTRLNPKFSRLAEAAGFNEQTYLSKPRLRTAEEIRADLVGKARLAMDTGDLTAYNATRAELGLAPQEELPADATRRKSRESDITRARQLAEISDPEKRWNQELAFTKKAGHQGYIAELKAQAVTSAEVDKNPDNYQRLTGYNTPGLGKTEVIWVPLGAQAKAEANSETPRFHNKILRAQKMVSKAETHLKKPEGFKLYSMAPQDIPRWSKPPYDSWEKFLGKVYSVWNEKYAEKTPGAAQEKPTQNYGMRNDGTPKGTGYFGELPMTDGSGAIATEMSIGIEFGGVETEIPTLVPTLSDEQKQWLLAGNDARKRKDIVNVATAHARARHKAGKSVWADQAGQPPAGEKAGPSGAKVDIGGEMMTEREFEQRVYDMNEKDKEAAERYYNLHAAKFGK